MGKGNREWRVEKITKVISGKEHTIGVGAIRESPLQRRMNPIDTWYKDFGKSPNNL
jgi:hypothetical protein